MKRLNSVKQALRNVVSSNDNRSSSPPAPSTPVITIKHLYAIDPQGSLVKYPGPPIPLTPMPYTGGNLRYSTDGRLTYGAALADLKRTAKMILLCAEQSVPWNSFKLQAEVDREVVDDNIVACKMLPLLNIQSQALDLDSAFLDMDTGEFSRALMSASATWGVNLALVVRWQPGRRQDKPLTPVPIAERDLMVDRRRGSAGSTGTIWPGPNAPRNNT
ncbi:hypothetical protein N0V93_004137 [Gnomoniopsis smithogilvyi]|uniref:Uncharacterized protein n=1 Tax=Gnomoniopsis smithogilvyi TaxID=1191159 RepID=A0A9W8YS20_9PEZI|nr:hypothetical protein N0V93_004137 [Gnomoniopsis smithogilvyi]